MTYKTVFILNVLFCSTKSIEISKESFEDHSFLALIGTYMDIHYITSTCCGCIITHNLILTTAHCYRPGENWIAMLLASTTEDYTVDIEKWIIHPYFANTTDTTYNDVALVKTQRSMNLYNVKPVQINSLPSDTLVHDLECQMLGWKIDDLNFLYDNFTIENLTTHARLLDSVYHMEKSTLSFSQCKALTKHIQEVIYLDGTFICIRHSATFIEEPLYGPLGSPLFCKLDLLRNKWELIGLKRSQRNIDTNAPETFVNIHNFQNYLLFRLPTPDFVPLIYFCQVPVCGSKYNVFVEYCIYGDKTDCWPSGRNTKYFFPKSDANLKWLSNTLFLLSSVCYLISN